MRGYIKRIGAMPAEARTAAGENGFENRIGAMLAEIRTAAGKKGYENGIGVMLADKWEEKYAEFDDYDGMPETTSTSNIWQRDQFARFDGMIKKEIAANEGSTL